MNIQSPFPDARLILFPDSGYGPHFQFPEEFALCGDSIPRC